MAVDNLVELLKQSEMLSLIFKENENVTNVNKGCMEDWLKNFGHGFLKKRWSYFKAKRHDYPPKIVLWDTKGSFVSVSR